MMRLDHNRAKTQIAQQTGKSVSEVSKMTVWGNHSATQFPDLYNAQVSGSAAIDQVDQAWYENEFIPTVQQRGGRYYQSSRRLVCRIRRQCRHRPYAQLGIGHSG